MKNIKTTSAENLVSYMPYSNDSISVLMSNNQKGSDAMKRTIEVVDVEFNKEGAVINEVLHDVIYKLDVHKNSSKPSTKEIELSTKEVELQIRENKLRKQEQELMKQEEKLKNKVNA